MSNRLLGTITMICAPTLLIEGILVRGREDALITGIASMVFMAGWICSSIGMWRMQATGTGKWGRTVLLIQLVGLVLAFTVGFFETTRLLGRESIVINITDAAWPLSMLWMIVVGMTVLLAKRLPGWRRLVPLLCPFWLTIAIFGTVAFGDAAGLIGVAFAAVLWALLGYVVFSDRQQPAPTPQSAVQ